MNFLLKMRLKRRIKKDIKMYGNMLMYGKFTDIENMKGITNMIYIRRNELKNIDVISGIHGFGNEIFK